MNCFAVKGQAILKQAEAYRAQSNGIMFQPSSEVWYRVTTGPWKSWKVLEFRKTIFQACKVMENGKGHGTSWKI